MEDSVTESQGMLPPMNLTEKEGENKSEFHSDQKTQEEREEEEEVGGGFIRTLMSTMATKTGEAETEDPIRDEIPNKKEDDEEEGGGGIFNNIISNLFPHNYDEQVHKMEVVVEDDEKNKKMKTEDEINNGGGVIENIVSHLPPSIPDDAVPTADEATILINSLVRD